MTHLLALLLLCQADVRPVSLADARRFPEDAAQAQRGWEGASRHRNYVHANMAYDFAWVADADWCWGCWNALDNVRRFGKNPETVLSNLTDLRLLLGDEAYQLGRMLPVVPHWRFTETR